MCCDCEAVRSAIPATAWLLVKIPIGAVIVNSHSFLCTQDKSCGLIEIRMKFGITDIVERLVLFVDNLFFLLGRLVSEL